MKRILLSALLGLLVAGAALAQAAGTNTVLRNGYCFNATTGQLVDCATGAVRNDDSNRDRYYALAPQLIYSDTLACIEATAGDTTMTVDLSPYRTVVLMFQVSGGVSSSEWRRFAVHPRYNFNGAVDSLSLFTMPVAGSDTLTATGRQVASGTMPLSNALGDGEFLVTLTTSATTTADANIRASLPQGKEVYLSLPGGARAWPSSCSFRIRSIGQEKVVGGAGNPRPPRLRVWVRGSAL